MQHVGRLRRPDRRDQAASVHLRLRRPARRRAARTQHPPETPPRLSLVPQPGSSRRQTHRPRKVRAATWPDRRPARPVGSGAQLRTGTSSFPRRCVDRLRPPSPGTAAAKMATHADLTAQTGCPVYFCDPNSPWQRGTNENTNRLLRQYLARSEDLRPRDQHALDEPAARLNNRPRRVLGWRTPAEVYTSAGGTVARLEPPNITACHADQALGLSMSGRPAHPDSEHRRRGQGPARAAVSGPQASIDRRRLQDAPRNVGSTGTPSAAHGASPGRQ